MSKPWTSADTATLERMQGRPDREIALALDRTVKAIRHQRQGMGIKAQPHRANWTRREWLLADSAGLYCAT